MGKRENKKKRRLEDEKESGEEGNASEPVSGDVGMEDWISQLAKKTAGSDSIAVPKEERKAKRAAKKARRQQRVELKEQQSGKQDRMPERRPLSEHDEAAESAANQERLKLLVHWIKQSTRQIEKERKEARRRSQPFEAKNKILHKARRWDSEGIQPLSSQYGGIGLARESLFISLDSPAWLPQLEQEFAEHIPGFFGKQRTKAMKKQLNKNMLWKRMLQDKDSKKKKLLSPEERAEVLLDGELM